MSKLFGQINNAVLDLQNSEYQTYPHCIKKLTRLLSDDDLSDVNQELATGVDLERFIATNSGKHRGMGSAHLNWPDDQNEELGLKLKLIKIFGEDPGYMKNFAYEFYKSRGPSVMISIRSLIGQLINPFIRDYEIYVTEHGDFESKKAPSNSVKKDMRNNKIFIVHGHDSELKHSVARFIENIGFEAIILHEQPNKGQSIIEKIESNADVEYALVLMSPDDEGKALNDGEYKKRARQNVLLELGYFMAHLGRDRVCALKRGELDIPSDFAGVIWEEFDENGGWKSKLAKELEAAGCNIDWNVVMRL